MPVSQLNLSLLLLASLAGAPALGADTPDRGCLDKAEQRSAVATHKALPLAQVVKTRSEQGQLVRARLCRRGDSLVYVLTLLGRNGKVVRATVDASTGDVIGGR